MPATHAVRRQSAQRSRESDRQNPALALVRKHWAIASGTSAIVLIAVVGGVAWWLNARQYVATDDATVDTRIVHIGPPMAGTIAGVPVTDNQRVEAGAVLATIAPAPPSSRALATGGDPPAAVAVHAPVAGWVAHLVAAPGSAVLPGQELMAIVPADFWITANFTETQLADMQTGQPATVTIDAFPGHTFDAHVESFQAGAGQAFSVLPPDNASGSFVKTAQRVPVKLLFDSPPKVSPTLGPGMSAYVRVKVR